MTETHARDCDVALHDASRRDPTGTIDVVSRMRADFDRRWSTMRRLARGAIMQDNILALGEQPSYAIIARGDPVLAFQRWIDTALARVVLGGDGSWTRPYLEEAIARARARAHRLTGHDASPRDARREQILASAAVVELQGVAEAVSQQATRAVANGLRTGDARGRIASAVQDRVLRVGRTRSRAMAEYEVRKAFGDATLDALEALGVTHVGVIPEWLPRQSTGDAALTDAPKAKQQKLVGWLTAGDFDVCPKCEALSEGSPYTMAEARKLYPAHLRCRCAVVPFYDDRFKKYDLD